MRINPIACIAFYIYIVGMRNIKSIIPNAENVKHGSTLHIARITDYNDRSNMPSQPKPVRQAATKKRPPNQQTVLSPSEQDRLDRLVVRFQRIVVGQNRRAVIENPDVIRAGLLALERIKSDEEFHRLIVEAQDRQ